MMVTEDQVREMALALPEAHEEGHWGNPSFRVRKRIFAVLYPDERRVVLKLPLELQEALVATAPKVFSLGGWSHQGWTHVSLRAAPKTAFRKHLVSAWREVAPKRTIKAYEESD